jgi:cytochrome c biogenesis protein
MKIFRVQKLTKIIIDLKFSILILALIAFASSFGSFIEQGESISFYKENYPIETPIYGFINYQLIITLGLNNVYSTWWFLLLLLILGISLIGCTLTRQFPLLENSKDFSFRKQEKSFENLPFNKIKTKLLFKRNNFIKITRIKFIPLSTRQRNLWI